MAETPSKFIENKNLCIRLASAENDASKIIELELASYDPDDAASPETVKFRLAKAGAYFYVLVEKTNDDVIGFINGTCFNGHTLEHDTMTSHIDGKSIRLILILI